LPALLRAADDLAARPRRAGAAGRDLGRHPQNQPLTMPYAPPALARALALLVPAAALAAAFGSQYLGGLVPCELCWWQRYAHIAALAFALLALFVRGRLPVWLAAAAIAASGAI